MSLSHTHAALAAWKLAHDQAISHNDAALAALALSRYMRTLAQRSEGGAA